MKPNLKEGSLAERERIASLRYYNKNRDKINAKRKENREKIYEYEKAWEKENKAHRLILKKQNYHRRIKDDLNYVLTLRLRSRLNKALKRLWKTGSAIEDLGCSIEDFKKYIESKFLIGMNWNNRNEWHLDHKRPLSSFDLTDREQLLQACHYTNIQPLWAIDNLRKNAKYAA